MKNKRYKTIYVDPPWYERGGGKIKRGADKHYPLMKTDDILALNVELIANENAHLYLWVTNNFLQDGLRVMRTWGFTYITNLVWCKPSFGLGQYFRGQHELLLFGVKGKLPSRSKPNLCSTIVHAKKNKHSQKPKDFYDVIELTSPTPRIELFAREKRKGWDAWGNEIDNDIKLI